MAKAREIPGLDGAMTYGDAAALTVEVRAQEIFDHEDGVLDVHEIERVHAMRVATRRLRAVLEIYEPCFPRKALRPVLAEVKELADALGARRDPDVELLALEQFVASVGPDERAGVQVFIDRTRAEQAEGNVRLAAALEGMRCCRLRSSSRGVTTRKRCAQVPRSRRLRPRATSSSPSCAIGRTRCSAACTWTTVTGSSRSTSCSAAPSMVRASIPARW